MAETRPYNEYEPKWQKAWEEQGVYHAADKGGQKFYGLIEFPFPSGEGLHVGHPRSYTAIDVVTRKKRMEGKNVLYPIGFDAFGLPTENFAIKNKVKPQTATSKNVANFTRQLKSMGFGFDWSRQVNTTDPAYYKWTQWMFLQFLKYRFDDKQKKVVQVSNPGGPIKTNDGRMAYKATTTINWCPSCKIGLANEEAVGGVCERCGNPVEKREKAQWMIRMTKYAERLLTDLDTVDYLDRIKSQQVNWIGKSVGTDVIFAIEGHEEKLTVYTTRVDTLFSAAFMVLAPEHPLVDTVTIETQRMEIDAYREIAAKKSDMDRTDASRQKTGAFTGSYVINPMNGKRIPLWIGDFVLASYGTGAVFGDAHDERDFEFAKKYEIPLTISIRPEDEERWKKVESFEVCYTEDGILVNSGVFDGMTSVEAREKITEELTKKGLGQKATNYKLRDWVFSRQRYWGEPIPVIICEKCGYVPVPENQLPVLLPDVDSYEPTDTGESPLAKIRDWVEVKCPACGRDAERETDTMPNWAGSSWYFLRYCDPHNDKEFASADALKRWMPVDLYNGGMEHTTLHLLYSRFWHKFLWDIGAVPKEIGPEPYKARRSHGMILAEGGEKMSKSKGNVINPDDVVNQHGADVLRVYELFIGPFDQTAPWDTNGIEGVKRFLDKIWRAFTSSPLPSVSNDLETLYHQTIKKVTDDIESLGFNTAVSQLMILTNAYVNGIPESHREGFLKVLAPFAPHLAEELWSQRGNAGSIHRAGWPTYDSAKTIAASFELVVQVNGKVRDRFTAPADISEEDAKAQALASQKVQKYLEGKEPTNIRYIKGRLVSVTT